MIPTIHNYYRQKSVHLSLPKNIFTFNTAVVTAEWPSQKFKWSKTDYSWQLPSHTFKCLGNPEHIESSPYLQDMLAYEWTLSSREKNCWDCSCLKYKVSNMPSQLDRSIHRGYCCFGVDYQSLLRVTQNLTERCIDKECICIWCIFQACYITGYRDITPGSEL